LNIPEHFRASPLELTALLSGVSGDEADAAAASGFGFVLSI
jgi:hypothetical protein